MYERAISVLLAVVVASCGFGDRDDVLTHQEYADGLRAAGLTESRLGLSWHNAAAEALDDPTAIELPHRETGAFFPHEARAVGLAFDALQQQRLQVTVSIDRQSTGRLFVQVFHVEGDGESRSEVAAVGAGQRETILLERGGRYVIRIQPELLTVVVYDLRIELEASLLFPVSGRNPQAVGSIFGDPRDAGRRSHEGVDIFAPRMTPLIAVADGVATTRRNSLGGNTVWLRAEGRRYYYAHLEEAAFEGRRGVSAGDVVGYVGNSGNARSTPPHLHFGIYRGRRGAIDPLPYLRSYTYASAPVSEDFTPSHIRTTASQLNLRSGPAIEDGNTIDTLPLGTLGRTLARSGHWLRIRTVDGREGWIHGGYQEPLLAREATYVPSQPHLVYADPVGSADAVDRIEPPTPLTVFAEHTGTLLVGLQPHAPIGWLRPTPGQTSVQSRSK